VIHGFGTGPARPVRIAVLALLVVVAPVVAVASAAAADGEDGLWRPVWSWRVGDAGLPPGCTPLSGTDASGRRWAPGLVSATALGLRIATAAATHGAAAGSGVECERFASRYGRLEVHARVPRAAGLVARVAFRPRNDRGTDWSGINVPSWRSGPAYVTNGSGDRVDGASLGHALSGRFHIYTVTWTPTSTSVSVDGHEVYRGTGSYDGPRRPLLSLAPTTATSTARTYLLVDAVTLDGFRPAAEPAAAPTTGEADPSGDHPTGTWTAGGTDGITGGSPVAAAAPAPTMPDRSAVGGPTALPAGPAPEGPLALVGSLDAHRLGTPWVVGGAVVAFAVLAGVLHAALVSRRRPAAR
jgi:hypothetical protein